MVVWWRTCLWGRERKDHLYVTFTFLPPSQTMQERWPRSQQSHKNTMKLFTLPQNTEQFFHDFYASGDVL